MRSRRPHPVRDLVVHECARRGHRRLVVIDGGREDGDPIYPGEPPVLRVLVGGAALAGNDDRFPPAVGRRMAA